MQKKRLAIVIGLMSLIGALTPAAIAVAPGPGDKQCVPGQNGPKQPGFKPPPSCPGNNH
jgi:hypothetical protein